MKKLVYYIPAITITVIVLYCSIMLREWTWPWLLGCLVLWISAIPLSKRKIYGTIPGICLGGYLIWKDSIYTGQSTNVGLYIGMFLCFFYFAFFLDSLKKRQ